MIEQQHASTEHWPLVHWLERPRGCELLGMHHHFQIPRIEFLHAAFEHDATAVDEHEIGQNLLDLFHLMRRHHDRAAAIEIIVQQRVVELFAKQDVETKRRLVQYEQFRVNRHDQREVQLRHHALG